MLFIVLFVGCKSAQKLSQREIMYNEAILICPKYFGEEGLKIICFSNIGELEIQNKV